jgi:hypothetical protein
MQTMAAAAGMHTVRQRQRSTSVSELVQNAWWANMASQQVRTWSMLCVTFLCPAGCSQHQHVDRPEGPRGHLRPTASSKQCFDGFAFL